ncbi:hypothetical protein UFOVP328_83 [uncultured Caudovirales phage]|jgi:hypothetical protein|uniref:Uncharacterized protein n=1 Tax=uncultured Caudovirales phage TaxID=2100421 RepID=A0A6J5LT98_9CAUD|nr:hypothetical protein UFOVP328_83 [uncultured Caudovirales phage]
MAKINSTSLVITVSEIVRDTDTAHVLLTPEMIAQLEAVVQQLTSEETGSNVIVEVQQA